jgi:hypothetical protein
MYWRIDAAKFLGWILAAQSIIVVVGSCTPLLSHASVALSIKNVSP